MYLNHLRTEFCVLGVCGTFVHIPIYCFLFVDILIIFIKVISINNTKYD